MKNDKVRPWIRILLVVCGLALIPVIFVPLWRIELAAPQYPEGLMLLIYPSKLAGNVDIINGLNHYIGMKTLHTADFIEFTLLPYIIGFFSFLFLVTAIAGKRKLLYILFILFVSFGILAMYDFWRWEYNYGHNLNPDAAIIVPGMAYQPPLIGFKQLLNFGAYSIPDKGGWIFVSVGVILLFCFIMEWRRAIKIKKGLIISLASLLVLTSCSTGPQAITPGVDNCYFCKMTVSDTRFGAEVVTKGRIYKFDDMHCLLSFLRSSMIEKEQVKDVYVTNYSGDHQLINAQDAMMLKSDELRSPMGGNMAAFNNNDSMAAVMKKFPGNAVNWNELNRQ
ncbi:MAG: nitrous oxide reductase accessory protein NosL [Chitinophagaceae bacterium]|nr:nitrous oxide reductase accessory protein NosL [Chitinophagaceae bacterium]